MSMVILRFLLLVVLLLVSPAVLAQDEPAGEAAGETPSLETEVGEFLATYVEAFNAADAEALASKWTTDAVWTDAETAATTSGRDAIVAELKLALTDTPGLRISGLVDRVQRIAAGVANLEGTVVTSGPDLDATTTSFAAVLVKSSDGWQFASVREFAPPVVTNPYEKLRELEFLVGEWQDDSEAAQVNTTVRWGTNQSFLVRTYNVQIVDAEPLQGTQVIGWDPRAQSIRSWTFDSQGGFGEGYWTRSGDEWVGRLAETLTDGGIASAMQVIRKVDDNTLEVATMGREVNGEPVPATPAVRVTRVAGASNEAAE